MGTGHGAGGRGRADLRGEVDDVAGRPHPGTSVRPVTGSAGRCTPIPEGWSTGRRPRSSRKPALRDHPGRDDDRLPRRRPCRRPAGRRSAGRRTTSSPATSPSTTRTPRAASSSACSSSSGGSGVGEEHDVGAELAEQQRLVDRHRPGRRGRRSPGRGPPSRGSTGSAARRGPTARAPPARRAARRPGPWSPAAAAPGRGCRRPSVTTKPSPSRATAVTSPVDQVAAVAADLLAAPGQQLGRRGAVVAEQAVHRGRRRVAGPAGVHHEHRAPGAAQHHRPVEAGGAAADHHHVVRIQDL